MNTQIKKIALILTSLLMMSLLAACDTVMDAAQNAVDAAQNAVSPVSQLQKVCNQEGGVEVAGTYDPAQVNTIAPFLRSSDSDNAYGFMEIMTDATVSNPDDVLDSIKTTWITDNEEADPAGVELVACITRSNENLVMSCEYEDETDVSKTYTLDSYEATYEVKVFVAKTGEELGSMTIDAEADYEDEESCPSTWYFPASGKDVNYPSLARRYDFIKFLQQYAEPGK